MIGRNIGADDVAAGAVRGERVRERAARAAAWNREPHDIDRNVAQGPMRSGIGVRRAGKVVYPLMAGLVAEYRRGAVVERGDWKNGAALQSSRAAETRGIIESALPGAPHGIS